MGDLNTMKSESLEEAQARLRRQSELEREGFNAVSEGQLVVTPEAVDDDRDGYRDERHQVNDALRVMPSAQDRVDEESAEWGRRALVENDRDASIHGEGVPRRAPKRASRKGGRKADAKAE